ncbi:hypothetical protein DITRI_Ditri17bG0081600 [Diplodiscus trichospermus]
MEVFGDELLVRAPISVANFSLYDQLLHLISTNVLMPLGTQYSTIMRQDYWLMYKIKKVDMRCDIFIPQRLSTFIDEHSIHSMGYVKNLDGVCIKKTDRAIIDPDKATFNVVRVLDCLLVSSLKCNMPLRHFPPSLLVLGMTFTLYVILSMLISPFGPMPVRDSCCALYFTILLLPF